MNDKQLVALQAAQYVKDGMLVGLGTGSTANYFIEELARRQIEDGLKITTVASSTISAQKAQSLHLSIVALEHISRIDLYVDGADEISADMTLLKGRGSDLVKEKLLAKAASQFIVVADASKLVERIGLATHQEKPRRFRRSRRIATQCSERRLLGDLTW
jgi:ribose 5-phosphate isomerase A